MDCKESQVLMTARLDDELDAAAMARLAEHLAACPGCTEEYDALLTLHAGIRAHGTRFAAPPHLKHRIEAALPRKSPVKRKFSRWPWAWINFGVALASSAAFCVTLGLYLTVPSATERLDEEIVASHYRSLLANHLTDVASSDQHTVKPWFTGKLDFSPPAYDLASEGFALAGGRLDYLNGRTVAALAYQHRRHVINLFVWPEKTADSVVPQSRSEQGFQLLTWGDHGLRYSAISDAAAQDLVEFRGLLEARMRKDSPPQSMR